MSSRTTQPATRRIALLGLLSLAGCGFAPVFGGAGAAVGLRNAVAVTASETLAGFALRSRLVDRLGPVGTARYALDVRVETARTAAAINSAGDTTRFNIVGTAGWVLTDKEGRVLLTGESQTFTSFSATGSTVATQTAIRDARERLAITLADMIVSSILAQAKDLPS